MAAHLDGPGEERVLVTGASGFIASHIVQQLQQEGYRVRGTVRSLKNETKIKHLKNLCPEAKHELELVEADLLHQECWPSAVKDCTYVLHVASPFPFSPGDHASTDPEHPKNGAYNEGDWIDQNKPSISAYTKSKLLAEKSAWELVKSLPDEKKFELATINPGYVVGPVLSGSTCSSMVLLQRILTRDPPANARIQLPVVDVRDVAKAHINAMTEEAATGHRHILVNESLWMADVAQILKSEFHQHGYNVSTLTLPQFVFSIVALFDKEAKGVKPMLNRIFEFDNTRMRQILKVTPTPVKDSFIDMAYTLIDGGFVKKHKNYKGKPSTNSKPEQKQESGESVSNSKSDQIQQSEKPENKTEQEQSLESEKPASDSKPDEIQESEKPASNPEPGHTQESEEPTSNLKSDQTQESETKETNSTNE